MKTLYLTNSCTNIAVDKATDEVNRIEAEGRYGIRDVYYIEEPMHVVYQYKEDKCEVDVKPGDILLQFYSGENNKHMLAIANSEDWVENILHRREILKKERELAELKKEEMAETPTCGDCCDACETSA